MMDKITEWRVEDKKDLKELKDALYEFMRSIKTEYTPLSEHRINEKRLSKIEEKQVLQEEKIQFINLKIA